MGNNQVICLQINNLDHYDTNATNAKAVCICCSNKNRDLQAAQLIHSYYTTNKAKLCHKHLANCNNFKNAYSKEEVSNVDVNSDSSEDEVDDNTYLHLPFNKHQKESTSITTSLNSFNSQ
ncbi:10148_t:CDS:2 [Funneliformis caledonium]|uniref:10148_t:CDS:1 n=1 Tax=Funneliformis caledonium TaxID=1117310 RepID=A0A9N9E255_9GLOM|nr:10148_t:CDS:2 [Funneliformis caledonium]